MNFDLRAHDFSVRSCFSMHLLFLAFLLLHGCGEDVPVSQASDNIVEPFPSTRILAGLELKELRANESDGTLRFQGTPTALAQIQPGHIIVAGQSEITPKGLLRFVGEIESDAQGLVLKTTEAPIQLAFRRIKVKIENSFGESNQPITFTDPPQRRMALSESISGGFWPSLTVDEYVFNGDNDPKTPLDQVHLTGALSGGIHYTFTLDVDWDDIYDLPGAVSECAKKLFKGSFSCSLQALMPEAKISFSVKPGAEASIGLEGVAFLEYKRPITVAETKLDPVPIGPLLFFPEIQILADISGKASSQFRIAAQASVGLETTVSFSNKSGGSLSPPNLTQSFSAPTVEASLGAKAKVRIGPRLLVTLYDVAGIYTSLYAAASVDASQSQTPCWKLMAGVEGDAGFLIKSPDLPLLGSVTIAKFQKDFDVLQKEIASGSCEIPSSVGPPPAGGTPAVEAFTHPTFTPWAQVYPDVVDGFPHEDPGAQIEWSQVTPTIDGRFMLTGSDAKILTKVDPQGKVVWARRLIASDISFWNDTLNSDLLPGRVVETEDAAMWVVAHPYTLLKMSAAGDILWSKHFEVGDRYRETWLRFVDAISDGAGGLFIVGTAGKSYTDPINTADAWVLHVGSQGQVNWSVKMGADTWGEIPRRIIRSGQNLIVTGGLWNKDGAKWRGFVAMLDAAAGGFKWGQEIIPDDCGGGYEQRIYPTAAIFTRDGDIIIGGSLLHSGYETVVMKFKADGTLAWSEISQKTVFHHLGPILTDLIELPTSGYLAAGYYLGDSNHEDIFLANLDAIGKVLWTQSYGGAQNPSNPLLFDDNYPSLLMTQDGGVIVGAFSESLQGEDAMWALKVPAKDGIIAFDPTSPAASSSITLESSIKTCVSASAWTPPLQPENVPLLPLTVRSETVNLQGTLLTP